MEILNIYGQKMKAPKFIIQTLLQFKSHTGLQTLIYGDFSTVFSPISWSSR